jgi:ATP-dependent RNA helicase RhlE
VIVPGFEPGAADVPAYESRPPRPERATERREPRAKPAAPRDTLFDAPYVAREAPRAESAPALVRPSPKKQVAALFRSPVKPDSSGQ